MLRLRADDLRIGGRPHVLDLQHDILIVEVLRRLLEGHDVRVRLRAAVLVHVRVHPVAVSHRTPLEQFAI